MRVVPGKASILGELALGLGLVTITVLALQAWLSETSVWLGSSVLAYLALAATVYRFWPRRDGGFDWPNRVTLARAALVAVLVGALALPGLVARHGTIVSLLALTVIVLDGLDGWLARLLDDVTRFGARFDMEVDALLILVLGVAVVAAEQAGAWVLIIGAMRYAFVLAGRALPWMRRGLPESFYRKSVCVTQGIVLAAALLPWIQPPLTQALLALSLALLAHSFARDIAWLARARDSNDPLPDRRTP